MKKRVLFSLCALWLLAMQLCSSSIHAASAEGRLLIKQYNVDGVARDARIYAPPMPTNALPIVFVFHGHGGTARNVARTFAIHERWPQAISVYMQGLNTPGRLTDPEGKRPGWQKSAGDQADRDIKFFDVVLRDLQDHYKVDRKHIYATGHSNGGGFTYLLWSERSEVFAAVAPSAAVAGLRDSLSLKPKPVMHLAGEKDALVKFEWQKLTINRVLQLNSCNLDSKPWENAKYCRLYESKSGNPVVTFIHPGGHEFLRDSAPLIVKFFQEHSL